MSDDRSKLIAIAKRRLLEAELAQCLDGANPASRPSERQAEFLKDVKTKHIFLRAGNQCLAEGTLVLTSAGPIPIEDIKPGMTVFDERGNPIPVIKVYNNGPKEVIALTNRNEVLVEATLDHEFMTNQGLKRVKDFNKYTMISRVSTCAPLGTVSIPDTYALGALLGDGCSRSKLLTMSSIDHIIPNKVAEILGGEAKKCHPSNYSWRLNKSNLPTFYAEWAAGRYAHEKVADLDIIKTWDRDTLLRFVAGIIDTDGSVYIDRWGNVNITIGMQAKTIVDCIEYAFLALWQVRLVRSIDLRAKYKNGPVHMAYTRNNAWSLPALKELDRYLVSPSRKWKSEYDNLVSTKTCRDFRGVKLGKARIVNTYDIHVDSDTNLYMLANGLVTHNSGKTSVMIRNLVWRLTETHPYWKRRTIKECPECGSSHVQLVDASINSVTCLDCNHGWKGWDGDQLVFLAVIQNSNHIQDMWENRIKPLLPPGSYTTKHDSGSLKYVTHKSTGNRIYFFSHDNPDVRKRVQSFSAHSVWIDEMPSDVKLFEELMRRCDAKDAQFFATFTPKVVNVAIKDFVENADPSISKQYRMSKFDNPIYAGRLEEERAKISQLPKEVQDTILYGDWQSVENKRLNLNPTTTVVKELPSWYKPSCDHVEAVDPASAGKVGYCLFVKDPTDVDSWLLLRACHVSGAAPTVLVKESLPEVRGGVHIVKYVSDPHEKWFITEAFESAGISYESPFNKTQRRKELLAKGEETLVSPTFTIYEPGCKKLIDELNSAEEDPNNPGDIKKASRYHCIDAWIYGLDLLPKYERPPVPMSVGAMRWAAWLEQEKSGTTSNTQRRSSWSSRQRWLRR